MNKLLIMFSGFFKYNNLLLELVVRDIKIRYRKSVLGLLWTLLNPLLMMLVMTMIFSSLFKTNIPYFPVYFLTGSILFSFHSEATTQALMSIISNASLIKKVYIPKYLFPLSRVLSSMVNLGFAFVALLLVMVIEGAPFQATCILFFIPIFYLTLFTTGLSLILSAMTVFFRDINHLYGVFTLLWTYMTPIFYPASIIPNQFKWILEYNPMYYYISFFRNVIIEGKFPGLADNLVCFTIGILTLIGGLITFYKCQNKFILHV
ncbi:ABC-2 type transport system permease protein [Paenibacillus sp. UNCCL117]|uniref:ABC transporter permease n=1 Tax=unclassified Paenibacillus TaxID=185978 RepID=UPI000880521C|nr:MULTISPECIES: ABC transporter permease [unclassified Paenibacillus]SDD91525.1 ABC-2 type transport system permease protein [Paenibacillus sp. cl123]SFW43687.1 ABC-2 type transport system permease protein [Paenibacillus sp. UNCCL117]